jgi:pimeloyl-ACP methyl ester carboxylesterase
MAIRSSTEADGRSPVPAILGSLVAGAALAVALLIGVAPSGSEPFVTGCVLVAFGLGWGLVALLTTRYSSQPQRWAVVPGALLGSIGLGLIVFQPGPAVMDLLSWVWPIALAALAIWMVVQVRQRLRGRGRWLVLPTTAVLLVCAVGGGLATVSATTGPGATTSAGRMIDVGGRRLYIECTGSGAPAVVLQSGLGESSSYWGRIAPSVAATTTVCAYDRAGHGRSDAADGAQDGFAIAADLRALLDGAGVVGPYVLVAHSSGGPYVRVFATRDPDAVAGVVLLDAQPADAFTALPDYPATYRTLQLIYGLSPSLARTGLLGPVLGLPADQSTAAAARSARDEFAILPDVLQQAQALTSFGDRPLVVVTAGTGSQAGWLAAQDVMTRMSTNSVHRIVATATHASLITGDGAADSARAILDLVATIRTGVALR